jgi:OOP family OmpA-OmpF porin
MAGIRLLAWLALIGWTGGSVYWHVCRIKQLCDAVPTTAASPPDPPPQASKDTLAAGQTEADLAAAETFSDVFKPMNLYFPTAQASYIQTPDNQRFFEEAKAYLAAHPGQKLTLTGHTDDEGDAADNLALSKQRAQAVGQQFQKRGIAAAQLLTKGRGEAEPVASNQTPAGRKANRRVTVVVQ